jgi:Ca2+-binding RTX toxin-like protein
VKPSTRVQLLGWGSSTASLYEAGWKTQNRCCRQERRRKNIIMTQSKNVLTKLAMSSLLLMAACGGETANKPRTYTFDATGFDGLDTQEMPLVNTACTYTAALTVAPFTPAYMTLTVGAGETLYVFKRATDGKVVANATVTTGDPTAAECSTTTTTQIRIVGSGVDHKVFLDYANGYFSMGTSLTVDTALSIRLGGGSTTDTVTIRGTGGIDNWNFGTTGATTTQQSAANLNFGTTTGNDKFVDITFGPTGTTPGTNIRLMDPLDVKVSTGAGADVITGQNAGLAAVSTGFVVPLTIWAGDDNDTISGGAALGTGLSNTLNGGAGNDTILQLGKVADSIVGGAGTDLVDYGSRTAALAITMGATSADDGESGEGDTIDGTVENVTGGTGNDVISAVMATGIAHVLRGGPTVAPATTDLSAGNDTLTGSDLDDTLVGGSGDDILAGSTGNDTILGGAGSDTISFADRTAGIVVVKLDNTLGGIGAEKDVFNLTGAVDIENIRGGDGADVLTGNTAANIIWGGLGADTIKGDDGSDTLYGQAGDDNVDGENGDDIIAGGDGADTLAGSAGNDLVDATEEGAAFLDTAVTCGSENDVVLFDSLDVGLDPGSPGSCETVL